jgi:hypothetical protein
MSLKVTDFKIYSHYYYTTPDINANLRSNDDGLLDDEDQSYVDSQVALIFIIKKAVNKSYKLVTTKQLRRNIKVVVFNNFFHQLQSVCDGRSYFFQKRRTCPPISPDP